jgi:tetratricopeptide (TPR) repeat protein
LAEDILKEKYGTDIIPDLKLIDAYASIDRIDKIVKLWEVIIEKNQSNPQYRVGLAASYLRLERRPEAIEQIQKAIELQPTFKEQGEYYISEILAGRNP